MTATSTHTTSTTPALLASFATSAAEWQQQCSCQFFLEPSSKSGRYALGLFFIVVQCIVWIVAAVLTQKLCHNDGEDEDGGVPPFVLSYIGMSLLSLLLPIHYFGNPKKKDDQATYVTTTDNTDTNTDTITETPSLDSLAMQLASAQHCSDYMAFATASTHQLTKDHTRPWNHRKHITAAIWLAPAMLGADFMFNQALALTSVASSTVLVSTQSLWVFFLAALVFRMEDFSYYKLGGVVAGVVGTAMTAWDDTIMHPQEDSTYALEYSWRGDVCAVVAALLYAMYTIQVKQFCPEKEDLYSMTLLLGYIGVICAVAMAPMGLTLAIRDVGSSWSWKMVAMMVAKGLMDFMVTDYCLFRAIVLTNATVATVGLGLTIPMAFGTDFVMGKLQTVTLMGLGGAIAIAIGFLIVNLVPDGNDKEDHIETDHDDNKDKDYHTATKQEQDIIV
jgi:solute carrier family 35 protein F5